MRVGKDFAGATSLRGMKLVFVVRRFNTDGKKAAVFARIQKRDLQGRDSELTDADFKGTVYEGDIEEGLFDGPEVFTVLEKKDGKWTVMTTGTGEDKVEAYTVGPTDVPYVDWDETFGIPTSWLGLSGEP